MDRQHSSFHGVVRPVSRLFKREQTVDRSVVSETLGDNTFDDIRDDRLVRDWTIYEEMVSGSRVDFFDRE
jgi:hypothetical protein